MSAKRSRGSRRSGTGLGGTSGSKAVRPSCGREGEKRHHLYVSPTTSAELHAQLAFRDRLRTDPDVARAYVALKRELASRYRDDRPAYTEGKTGFIEATLGVG